ncbi:DNA integrity scanning protein DisA nucleotide-binding domain protein [bacterium]|nr:DNA integrity scanning protein DisA nucleotide-binding domain protein [bacterium]
MPDASAYPMWRYQRRFQLAADAMARSAFSSLDEAIEARLFLVGFRRDEAAEGPAVCVEPDGLGHDASLFATVPALADELYREDPEHRTRPADSAAQQSPYDRVLLRSWQRAVERTVAREEDAAVWRSFASWPVDVEDYRVVCVLQLPDEPVAAYYALTRDTVDDYYRVATSLLDALAEVFLTECGKALGERHPGRSRRVVDSTISELHRNAGRGMTQTLAWVCRSYESVHALYDALCDLAATRYEGAPTRGRLLVSAREHPNVERMVEFDQPVLLEDTRAARKLLEVTSGTLCALSEGAELHGLGRLSGGYDEEREDLFVVDFVDHQAWQLSHGGQVLMRVHYGQPGLPVQPLDAGKLRSTIRRIFRGIGDEDITRLRLMVRAATRQVNGTLLVISDHAAEEARRLAVQSTLIQPTVLTASLVHSLSAIDGALLVDPQGTCHAIGVILDGLACAKGTSARGARFNSAVRYVETARQEFGHQCMAIVVSEDGPIDIVPDLRPQVSRRLVPDQIEAFGALTENPPIRRREFNRFLRWFQEHRAYLSQADAARINAVRRGLEPHLEPSSTSIFWQELKGNPDVDDSYFADA